MIIEKKDFNIKQILECGQHFRHEKINDKEYLVIAENKILHVEEKEEKIIFNSSQKDFEKLWKNYFDLNRDYSEIKKQINVDKVMNEAINFGSGIRILNQDSFEMLITFIISQNNRIPMIKTVIKNLSKKFGEKIDGDYYSFPTVEKLYNANIEEIKECKAGFRAKYIKDACEKVYNNEINIYNTEHMNTKELKEELIKIKGVGEKVANCIVLFGYGRREAFPVDVWVKRVMEHYYFENKDTKLTEIERFGNEKFKDLSGYAQQYLFYIAREQGIGKKK